MSTTDSRPDHDSSTLLGLGCNEGLGAAHPERAAFERWFSDDGAHPAAVERSGDSYKLMGAHAAWVAWKAAATATRENCAETIDVLVCECCHKESEVEFARYLAGEIRGA
jgi:hypothetical protein